MTTPPSVKRVALIFTGLLVLGSAAPYATITDAANEDPDPALEDIHVPDEITVGESVTIDVTARNNGGKAGHWSTISVSSPTLDERDDGSQVEITDSSDHVYSNTATAGDRIVDKDGERITADYVLAEGGTNGDTVWDAGERRSLSVEFTPEQAGTFVLYIRVTFTDDDDTSEKFNEPRSSSRTDQQDFHVYRYEVDVKEEPRIDAHIVEFDQEHGTFRPGETVRADTAVENTGNREHTFYVGYSFIGPDGDAYDNDGTTHEPVRLDPGEQKSVDLSWTIPEDAPEGEYDAATAVWKREESGKLHGRLDEETDDDAITVEHEEIEARITSFDAPSGTYEPGEKARATTTIKNTGNVKHTFYVGYGFIGPDGNEYDNDGTTHESITLDDGERGSVDLSWTVPEDAPEGEYDAVTAAWKREEDGELHGRLDTERQRDAITVEPEEVNARITSFDAPSGTYRSGEKVRATTTIKNTGNVEHTFYVGYGFIGPDGNEYDNDGTTHEPITLEKGERGSVDLSWTIPEDAPEGEYDAVTAVWKREENGELHGRLDTERRRDTITVEQKEANARIKSFDAPSGIYRSGDKVRATTVVENTGDLEHTFYVGYGFIGPDGNEYDNEGTTHEPIRLDPNERASVDLSWTVPEDAPEGEYDAVTAVWKRKEGDKLQGRLDDETEPNAITVKPKEITAQIVSFDAPSGTYKPGDEVRATTVVENTGPVEHTFYVGYGFIGPDGNEHDNDGTTHEPVTLNPDEQKSVDLSWTVPEDAPEGEYDAVTAVWKHETNGRLDGRLDTERRRDAITVKPDVVKARIISFDAPSGIYQPGDDVRATTLIENTGTVEHTFYVGYGFIGPDGNDYDNDGTTHEPITLSPNEQKSVSLSWIVPEDASKGEYDSITAIWKRKEGDELQGRLDDKTEPNAITVKPEEITAQIVSFNAPDGTYKPGDEASATTVIENTGTVEHTFYVGYSVQGPDGEWRDNDGTTHKSIRIAPDETQRVRLSWTVEEDAADGQYGVLVALYKRADGDELHDRVDNEHRQDSFQINREIKASITNVDIPSGPHRHGDQLTIGVDVRSTSNVPHTFYVSLTATGPNGDEYATNHEVGTAIELAPGKDETVQISWTIPQSASKGTYDTRITLWKEDNSQNLETPVDATFASDSLSVEIPTIPFEIQVVEQPQRLYEASEVATTTLRVQNPTARTRTLTLTPVFDTETSTPVGTPSTLTLDPQETRTVTLQWPFNRRLAPKQVILNVQQKKEGQVIDTEPVGTTAVVEELVSEQIVVQDSRSGRLLDDVSVDGYVYGYSRLPTGVALAVPSTFSATRVQAGVYTFKNLPAGLKLSVSISKPGYKPERRMIDVGGSPSLFSNTVRLRRYAQGVILVEDRTTGDSVNGLKVKITAPNPQNIDGTHYLTDSNGLVGIGRVPIGASVQVRTAEEHRKRYWVDQTVTIKSSQPVTVRAKRLVDPTSIEPIGEIASPATVSNIFDESVPGDSTWERITNVLNQLADAGASGWKIGVVREPTGLTIFIADLTAWKKTHSKDAVIVLPASAQEGVISSPRFDNQIGSTRSEISMQLVAGMVEGLQTQLSSTSSIDYYLSSTGVYVDRSTSAYKTGRFITELAPFADWGDFKAAANDGDVKGMAWHGGWLALDAVTLPVGGAGSKLKGAGKGVSKGIRGVDALLTVRRIKSGDELSTIGSKLGDRIKLENGRVDELPQSVKDQPPRFIGAALKHSSKLKRLSTDEQFTLIRRYYADKGDGITRNAAKRVVDDGTLTKELVVKATKNGIDMRAVRTLSKQHDIGEETIRGLVRGNVRARDVNRLLESGALTKEELQDLVKHIDPESSEALNQAKWDEIFVSSAELRQVEGFTPWFRRGSDSSLHRLKHPFGGNARGVRNELEVALQYGPQQIDEMGIKISDEITKGGGEIDIALKDGRLVEVKSSVTSKAEVDELMEQMESYKDYARQSSKYNENEIEIAVKKVSDVDTLEYLKNKAADEGISVKYYATEVDGSAASSVSQPPPSLGKSNVRMVRAF